MNNLKKLRTQKGKTQVALSIDTRIDQALISKYERGLQQIPSENLIILADYFETSIDYLLGRTEDATKY